MEQPRTKQERLALVQRLLRDGRTRVRANAATGLSLMPDIALTSAALMAAASP